MAMDIQLWGSLEWFLTSPGSCHGLGLEKASGRVSDYESGGPPWMALVILKGFHMFSF